MYTNSSQQYHTRLKTNIFGSKRAKVQIEDDRTGMSVETLKRAIADNLYYMEEVVKLKTQGYNRRDYYNELREAIDRLTRGKNRQKTAEPSKQKIPSISIVEGAPIR